MNIDEFLDKLAKQRHTKEWGITQFGRIRSRGQCPISSLMNRSAWEYPYVGEKLGLKDWQIMEIANTADNAFPTPLRKKMLNVLGLTE